MTRQDTPTTAHNQGPRRNMAALATARERQAQALELRKQGLTWATIADRLGYNDHAAAYRAAKKALDRIPAQSVDDYRKVELERLEHAHALAQIAVKTRNEDGTPGVNLKALDTITRISERRSKLLGLDHNEARQAAAAEASVIIEATRLQLLTHALYTALTNAGLTIDQQTAVVDHFNQQLETVGLTEKE